MGKLRYAMSARTARARRMADAGAALKAKLLQVKDNRSLRYLRGGRPAGPGRPKGLLNKFTGDLKEAYLQAAQAAGGKMGSRATSTTKR